MRHDLDADWQNFFPTYRLGSNEIALAEYNAASERAKSDDNAVSIANGVLLAALLPVLPAISPFLADILKGPSLTSERLTNFAIFILAMIMATGVVSAYFCHLRRSYVFSARKVIVLRRMLGQSYGVSTLVLPNWRIEGADHPFAIRLFPGWRLQSSYPYYAIAALAASVAAFGFSFYSTEILIALHVPLLRDGFRTAHIFNAGFWFFWFFATLYYIRRSLFDHFETSLLILTKLLCKILKVRLQGRTHSVLYSAKLARYEAIRHKIELRYAKEFAVEREDRRFYGHNGNDWLAMARAARDRFRGKKAGGGTTITQQLARTLFIKDFHKTVRRKVVEVLLARWLEKILTKQEIIEIYLCSVRYEREIFGIAHARSHFFGQSEVDKINSAILIERISSVTGKFRRESTAVMLEDFVRKGLLEASEAKQILVLYRDLISAGKISAGSGGEPEEVIAEFEAQYKQYG
ncbi:biosynthetic peptidoglycan transglycosylase [Devosia sp. CAU 1758]